MWEPRPGQFENGREHPSCGDSFAYTRTLDSENAEYGDELVIAAHADVISEDENESAWAEGENFPGANWAMYFKYTVREPA